MKNIILTIGIVLISLMCFSQGKPKDSVTHNLIISPHIQQGITNASFTQYGVLFGFTSSKSDQFAAGPVYRHYKEMDSYGFSFFAQNGSIYPIILAIKMDFLANRWKLDDEPNRIKKLQGFAALNIGYAFTPKMNSGLSLNTLSYDPNYSGNKSAFKPISIGLYFKYDFYL